MKRLIKLLDKYNKKNPIPIELTSWQRKILFEHIIEQCENIQKSTWFKNGRR